MDVIVDKSSNKMVKVVDESHRSIDRYIDDFLKHSRDDVFIIDSDELDMSIDPKKITKKYRIYEDGSVVEE